MNLSDPELRDIFEEEATENLDAIEGLLPCVAETGGLRELRRHAHTLKGSAGVMGIAPVSAVAAALEELFAALEASPVPADAEVRMSLHAVVGDLRYLVSGLLCGLEVGNVASDAEQALHALRAAISGEAAPAAPPAAPSCPRCSGLEDLVRAVAVAQAHTLRLLAREGRDDPQAGAALAALTALLPEAAGPGAAVPPGPPRRARSVVVVDDSRLVRERHRSILAGAGYDVRTAADGHEALQLLAEAPADAVISDLDMPGMDGLRLTQSIRDDGALRELAVLVVTSHGDELTRDRLRRAGADGFVAKDSVDADGLVAHVGRLLEGRS